MGLFDGKAKQEAAESEIIQKLSNLPILDLLIENIMNDRENSWIYKGQSYYDSCRRIVTIEPDGFAIEVVVYDDGGNGNNQGGSRRPKEQAPYVAYSYTKSGYIPLHGFSYDNGKKEIPTQRVCCLWASVIRERMAALMTDCSFGNVSETASFYYSVPEVSLKDWF